MKKILLLLIVLSIFSQISIAQQTAATKNNSATASPDYKVAVDFLNKYIQVFNSNSNIKNDVFLKQCGLVTKNFITKFYAYNNDDDLLFDPVVAAEDFPTEFVFDNMDAKTGYIIVRGTGNYSHKVAVKLIQVSGKWLVDGSGVINIPKDKRPK